MGKTYQFNTKVTSKGIILYISPSISSDAIGGDIVNKRNLDFLKKTGYIINTYSLSKKKRFQTLLNLISGYAGECGSSDITNILNIIKGTNIQKIFISSSKLGVIAKTVKKVRPDIEIITFFHNIEIDYSKQEYHINKSVKNYLILKAVQKNERLSVAFSDKIICLNDRDNNLLNKYYQRKCDYLLPISFYDQYKSASDVRENKTDKLSLLFVGSDFYGNIEGLKWFITNVFPHIQNTKLIIIGKGMDRVFTSDNDRLIVKGYVKDLQVYYNESDIVVLPIVSGGGMKTKTAEAMMYGCPIIGTEEAFEGYDLEPRRIGAECKDAEAFISTISNWDNNKKEEYSKYSRSVFLSKYNSKSLLTGFINFINK